MTNLLPSSSLLRRAALVPMLALGLAACDDDDDNGLAPDTGDDIVDIATTTPEVSTLAQAVQAAGLVEALRGNVDGFPGPFTVFAPVNSAFASLPAGELDRLLQPENVEELQELLLYHVLPFQLTSATLTEGSFTTLAGDQVTISLNGGVFVNGAEVTTPDVQASNGVIHLIDEVLLPPRPTIAATAAGAAGLSTLAAALDATGLDATLAGEGPFTVFAPVDPAFAALGSDVIAGLLESRNLDFLSEILTYHVVPGAAVYAGELTDGQTVTTAQGEDLTIGVAGSAVTVNGANVTTVNIRASNGVIHLIDGVLTPELDIVEKALLTEQTTTLATAVQAGDLQATLQGTGPFTVFAPANSAFAALDPATLDALLDPANIGLLQEILTYHVVAGDVRAADLTDGPVTTVEGRDVVIDLSGAVPTVNGADIVATDIVVQNGVIHLIDEVLLPELDIVETAVLTPVTQTLAAAVAAGDLVTTLEGAGPFTVFAPVNAAFEALGTYSLDALLDPANQAILQDVLTYHVVPGDIRAADLSDGLSVATVEGNEVVFDLSGATPMVNGANIIATDIVTENGVIHLIDGVLTESMDVVQRAIITQETATLVDAVVAGDLVTTLQGTGPFTVFAPINAAFEALGTTRIEELLAPENQALLQKVLTYHVVPGDVRAANLSDGLSVATVEGTEVVFDLSGATPMVNGANIIATDIVTENGVIHLIDGVLTENLDIVDKAVLNSFDTLVQLVADAGLAATLRGDNGGAGYTVFAPTDEAFTALSSVPTGAALTDVLLYHVVGATVGSGALSDGQVVTAANGDTFTVNIDGTAVSITDGQGNTVNVILTDVPASNGVIHVIDGVILPPTS